MIRVLHVVNSMGIGGIETFLMNVYRNIDKNHIQFDFLLHQKTDSPYEAEIEQYGGKLYYLSSRRDGFFKSRKELDAFFTNHPEYHIVHDHVSCLTDVDVLLYAKKHGVNGRIIHAHSTAAPGNRIHLLLHKINKRKIRTIANCYYSCSDAATNWLYSNTGIINAVEFIPNGIDCNRFNYNELIRNRTREKLNLNSNRIIIHIGRMSYEKNHLFLLDVFKIFHDNNPDSKLLLVGDGVLRAQIQDYIVKQKLQDSVLMLGQRQDIPDLLMAADLFVLPSIFEGFPVSIIEAQATGIPCLYSKNITSTAMVTNNIKQVDLDLGAEIWAKEICNMLELNRDYNANSIVSKSEFNIKSVSKRLFDNYMSILG